jgi:hypothetical protein
VQSASPGYNPYAPPSPEVAAQTGGRPPGEPPAPAPLRVDGAFGRSFGHVRRFLFAPFDIGKWIVFGFIVFLAELGEGTNYPSRFNLPGSGGGGGAGAGGGADMQELLQKMSDYVRENVGAIIAIGVASTLLILALSLLFMWLSARGTMMALRAVALDHARLGEHWRETRDAAWSYLGFRLLLGVIALPVSVGVLVWGGFAAWSVLESGASEPMDFVRALIGPGLVLILFSLLMAPVQFLGRNILAPMLLKFGDGLRANWRRTMAVVTTSFGGVALFMLVRIGIAIVQAIAELIVVYATCCIGLLWVIHQTLVAPFHVFERAYTLFVLESLGPAYKLIVDPPPPAYPQYPGYPGYPGYPPPGAPPPVYPPYPPR